MQPYPNPNYFSYQQNMPNFQQPYMPTYQAPQMSSIVGKVVDNFESIAVSEVPMDGSIATFIKRDGSEIQTRAWNANGQIVATCYKPYTEPKQETTVNSSSNELESLYEDFRNFKDEVISRFDRLDKSVSSKSNTGRGNRREVESDE